MPDRFNPFVDGFISDPYSHYDIWRARESVHWGQAPDERAPGCWYIFDYAHACTALTDDRFGLELSRVIGPDAIPPPAPEHAAFDALIGRWMIFRDPPDHTRLRRGIMPAFTQRALSDLSPEIDVIAERLVAAALTQEAFDLIADVAFPLPAMIIGRMLGFADVDYSLIKRCSRALLAAIDLKRDTVVEDARAAAARAVVELEDYLRTQIARRRADHADDLLARLVAATADSSDGDDELVANCVLMLFAGHKTTVNLIGNGFHALLSDTASYARLRAEPDLLPSAVEELARFDSPSQMTFRFAMEPIALGGRLAQPGDPVGIVIGAANRDPAVFAKPNQLDLARAPNPHLSFGRGRHSCLGAALARKEALAAFRCLLDTPRPLALAEPTPLWSHSIGLRGLRSLWVRTRA